MVGKPSGKDTKQFRFNAGVEHIAMFEAAAEKAGDKDERAFVYRAALAEARRILSADDAEPGQALLDEIDRLRARLASQLQSDQK